MSHLTNPLASAAQLARCQACAAQLGLPPALLDTVFFAVQRLVQAGGLLLTLPQSTTARANVLLARYWLVEPGFGEAATARASGSDYAHVAAAALYTAAKTGAAPRTARDVANVFAFLATAKGETEEKTDTSDRNDTDDPSDRIKHTHQAQAACYLSDAAYNAFHSRVLALEARLLAALGFDGHVALPHPLALTYLQALDFFGTATRPTDAATPGHAAHALARRTLAYLNTALLCPQLLYCTHQPHELAVAAIYCAASDCAAHMPPDTAWWDVFDVDRESLGFLALALRSVAAGVEGLRQSPAGPLLHGGILTRHRVAAVAAQWPSLD